MKPKLVLAALTALTLVVVISAVTLGRRNLWLQRHSSPERIFQVHGQIRGVQPADMTVRIAHDAIANYMPAMTMSLPVKNAALLSHLAIGDDVQFELRVTDDDSSISRIEKIPPTAAATQAEAGATRSLEEIEAERLRAGELVPDFMLTDQDGRAIHLKEFRGKAVVLTFIYTRCPLPNFCPLMSKKFAELEHRLSKEFPNRYELLSISMDPAFDRQAVLKEYAARYGADPKDWSFATGDAGFHQLYRRADGLIFRAGKRPHLARSAHRPDRPGRTAGTALEKQRLDPLRSPAQRARNLDRARGCRVPLSCMNPEDTMLVAGPAAEHPWPAPGSRSRPGAPKADRLCLLGLLGCGRIGRLRRAGTHARGSGGDVLPGRYRWTSQKPDEQGRAGREDPGHQRLSAQLREEHPGVGGIQHVPPFGTSSAWLPEGVLPPHPRPRRRGDGSCCQAD